MRPQKVVFLLLSFLLAFALVRLFPEKVVQKPEGPVSLLKSWGRFPVSFVENQGQSDPRIRYSVLGSDKTLYFGPSGLTVSIHPKKGGVVGMKEAEAAVPGWNVKMEFVGANETGSVEGGEKAEATFNYFKGAKKDWRTGVPTYRSIVYRELWSGVDLVYSGTVDQLKQDFIVRPHADAGRIQLAYLGLESAEMPMTAPWFLKRLREVSGMNGRRPINGSMEGKSPSRWLYWQKRQPLGHAWPPICEPICAVFLLQSSSHAASSLAWSHLRNAQ